MGRVVVVGAARSGLAVAAHLAREGREVVLTDRQGDPAPELCERLLSIGVPGVWGDHPLNLLEGCEEVIVSPGVPLTIPFVLEARRKGIPVSGELEWAHRVLRAQDPAARILAVTGTNGKSTTTDLVAHLLRVAGVPTVACGNLGTPLMEALERAEVGTCYAVECSSYQLETIATFRAEGAAFLNLTPDHLARHGTMEAYRAAKLRIFERQGPEDVRVIPLATPWDLPGSGRTLGFGWLEPSGDGAWCTPDGHLCLKEQGRVWTLLHRSALCIPGDHNVENALAALLLARHGGASLEALVEGLRTYPGLAHRIAFCAERDGIRVYNDSKGTNVDATLTAIRALPGPLVLILGGEDKGASYVPLIGALQGKLRKLIFLGDAIPQLRRDLGHLPHEAAWAFDEAVTLAFAAARPGDQVLLSPACASFDQFRNFEHRGEHFEALARAWALGSGA